MKAPIWQPAAQAGELTSSPLVTGASGRLWIAKDGRVRLELQAPRQGDTQILYDGHTVSLYDASTNTLYRYTAPPAATSSHRRTERRPRSPDVRRRSKKRSPT